MSKGSLQDQLLRAGVAKKSSKRPKKSAWGRVNRHEKKANSKPSAEIEAAKQAAEEKREQERKRQREAGRRRHESEQRRAQRAEIRQLVLDHAERLPAQGTAFHFAVQGRVLSLSVSPSQRRGLSRGTLRLAVWNSRYHIVSAATAEKIAERDPAFLTALPTGGEIRDQAYTAFEVPDDLIW